MAQQFFLFLVRWVLNSVALWIALRLLGHSGYAESSATFGGFLVAGLVLSLVNAVLRPFVIVLSLPAILLTLGLFMLVVNGMMVYIALHIVPDLQITFVGAIVAGMIVSLTNYLLSAVVEIQRERGRKRG
jgi:putative membrane protein